MFAANSKVSNIIDLYRSVIFISSLSSVIFGKVILCHIAVPNTVGSSSHMEVDIYMEGLRIVSSCIFRFRVLKRFRKDACFG